MLFNSLHFLAFFPLVCVAYYMLPTLRGRNLFLLAASYYFYINWEPAYALLLLSSTLVTYLAALGIEAAEDRKRRKRAFLTASLLLNLGLLFAFKYYNFAAAQLTLLLHHMGVDMPLPRMGLLLPVGISFYIFQALGYTIDVYRRHTPAERNVFTYALFVSFFPQLVAGPIERSTHLLGQFKTKHPFDLKHLNAGVGLMLWGYFLKLALADRCALYVDAVWSHLPYHSGGSYLLAALLFPFQIYGDFAGYSLIAVGAARVMGFRLMNNFCQPYLATTISHFWHRWHISLSTWFRDYVYIPLGGNRVGRWRGYANVMITFLVSGLWHGANFTFVLWGALHGALQCLEKALGWHRAQWTGLRRALHWGLTLVLVCVLWIFFRASSVAEACTVISGIFTRMAPPTVGRAELAAALMALSIVAAKDMASEMGWHIPTSSRAGWLLRHLLWAVLVAYILLLGVLDSSQFIYFQF